MREDFMAEWLRTQRTLQEESYGVDFDKMSDEERIEFITWNVLALTDELHEALAEIGWKPWATSRHINTEALQGELVDAMHFMGNLIIASGLRADQLMRLYRSKRATNAKRQEDGYDGVTTKCANCNRALDDAAVEEVLLVDDSSGTRMCRRCADTWVERFPEKYTIFEENVR